VVLGRLGFSTADVGGPTLSYLVWSGGSDVEPRSRTTPRPRTDPTSDAPTRRGSPDREPRTILETVVRELVHVREPLTVRQRRADVGLGAGSTASTEAPTVDRLSEVAGVPGRDTGDTTSASVEWSVVRHGGWTGAVDSSQTGTQGRADPSPASRRAITPRDDTAPLSVRRETTTTTTAATAPHGPLAGPTGVEGGRHGPTPQPRFTVAADIDTRPVERSSLADGRNRESDAFGPPTELTVRRAGGATGGSGGAGRPGTGRAGTGGTTTQPVDLADLGGTSGRAGRTDPASPTGNSGTPSARPSLDLSGAPKAEVDRFVDRLYGELTRRHRIERERRGR
jgi:hypothetical protein